MKLENNKILITGGATGIGLGLTERFLKDNNTVIICGRREEKLNEVSKKYPSVITKVCDLSLESERTSLYEWIAKEHSDLNVLVNNAGIQNFTKISDADFYERAKFEITTNITAPLHLVSLFEKLDSLTTIMNVSSGLAFVQLTPVPVYCATKSFIHSFTLSMRYLLAPKGIEVIEIIPPALDTDLGKKGARSDSPSVAEFIEAIFIQLKEGKSELTFGFSAMIENAAPDVVKGLFGKMNP